MKILLKRWYIVVPILIASLVVAAAVVLQLPATYQASASVVVLGPSAGTGTGADRNAPANPYLQLGGSQDVVAQVLLTVMNSDSVRNALKDQGVADNWKLTVTGASGPVLQLNVQDATPEKAIEATSTILKLADQRLSDIQTSAGAPNNQLARLSILSTPRSATSVLKTKIRVGLALGFVGLLLACGAAFAFEGVRRRRLGHRPSTEVNLVPAPAAVAASNGRQPPARSDQEEQPREPEAPAPVAVQRARVEAPAPVAAQRARVEAPARVAARRARVEAPARVAAVKAPVSAPARVAARRVPVAAPPSVAEVNGSAPVAGDSRLGALAEDGRLKSANDSWLDLIAEADQRRAAKSLRRDGTVESSRPAHSAGPSQPDVAESEEDETVLARGSTKSLFLAPRRSPQPHGRPEGSSSRPT